MDVTGKMNIFAAIWDRTGVSHKAAWIRIVGIMTFLLIHRLNTSVSFQRDVVR